MPLSRLLALFKRSVAAQPEHAAPEHTFAMRHHRFKLFLTAWNKFQEVMTELEYTLCCNHPFGMYRVRALCTRMATQVFQCIRQLERLSPGNYAELHARFAALQNEVSAMVYPAADSLSGPSVLPLGDPELEGLADPAILRLGGMRAALPDVTPPGFVITAAGCRRILEHDGLQEEINRRIQAAGGLSPATLPELSENLCALVESAPIPAATADAVLEQVRRLREETAGTAMRLLFRGRLWPEEKNGDHGLLLWGPSLPLDAPDERILAAVRATLARKQQAQALVYRRYRGLIDAGTGVCIACLAVEDGSWGGVAHTGNPMQPTRGSVHVYACRGLPQDMEYSRLPTDVVHVGRRMPCAIRLRALADPERPVLDDDTACAVAELALRVEALEGKPQSLTWVRTPGGALRLLLTRPMILANLLPHDALDEAELPPPLAAGGVTASPGIACGPVHVVRTWDDARNFPVGGVLVAARDLYQWIALLDRAAAVITEEGILSGRLGSLAREFGKPAVFGLPGATRKLAAQDKVTVYGDGGLIFSGCVDSLLAVARPPRDFMPGSPVYRTLQHAGEHILPLTLDPDSADFKAANCRTYHDIARYCHEKAVGSMFTFGSHQKHAPEHVKQLRDGVLKQFWVVNLDDGFDGPVKGPVVDVSRIASLPMRYVWQGMNAYPWQGPPPVDGKGFLSVLFEATANPHLDPAAQTAYFSEKNYFLVARDYCSLHSRFGFHFVSVESRLGERTSENYVVFQLRGGAANIERRILRVRFVADILWECGFAPVVRNDAVAARVEGMDMRDGAHFLEVAGYMTIHTRQLDMIMADPAQVEAHRAAMLEHCRTLITTPPPPVEVGAPSSPAVGSAATDPTSGVS